jgi:hypothetical protein
MPPWIGFLAVLLIGFPIVVYINATWWCHYLEAALLGPTPENGTEYDFIVVGSGSAGSVVAGRLGEAGHSVLLVEAGGPSHWMQGIPCMVAYFMTSPYDWKYKVRL